MKYTNYIYLLTFIAQSITAMENVQIKSIRDKVNMPYKKKGKKETTSLKFINKVISYPYDWEGPAPLFKDVISDKYVQEVDGYTFPLPNIAWNTNSKTMAYKCHSSTITIVDLTTQEETRLKEELEYFSMAPFDLARCLSFNPQGTMLAVGYRAKNDPLGSRIISTIQIWDAKTGIFINRMANGNSRCTPLALAFNSNGEELASGLINGMIKLWNPKTAELINEWQAHDKPITALAYNFSQPQLATTSSDDQTIKIWDLNTKKNIQIISIAREVISLGFHPHKPTLIGCSKYPYEAWFWKIIPTELFKDITPQQASLIIKYAQNKQLKKSELEELITMKIIKEAVQ